MERRAQRPKVYTSDQAVGLSSVVLHPAEERGRDLLTALLDQARRDGHVVHTGWRIRRDGSRFRAQVAITALLDGDGRVTGSAEITSDLTGSRLLMEGQREFNAASPTTS